MPSNRTAILIVDEFAAHPSVLSVGSHRIEEDGHEGLPESGRKLRVLEEDFLRLMFDTEGS
jgi:hypothetical protein